MCTKNQNVISLIVYSLAVNQTWGDSDYGVGIKDDSDSDSGVGIGVGISCRPS